MILLKRIYDNTLSSLIISVHKNLYSLQVEKCCRYLMIKKLKHSFKKIISAYKSKNENVLQFWKKDIFTSFEKIMNHQSFLKYYILTMQVQEEPEAMINTTH